MALILWSTEEITWEEQELVQRSSFSLEKNWKASSFLHGLEHLDTQFLRASPLMTSLGGGGSRPSP